jgi:hypothetical protein
MGPYDINGKLNDRKGTESNPRSHTDSDRQIQKKELFFFSEEEKNNHLGGLCICEHLVAINPRQTVRYLIL